MMSPFKRGDTVIHQVGFIVEASKGLLLHLYHIQLMPLASNAVERFIDGLLLVQTLAVFLVSHVNTFFNAFMSCLVKVLTMLGFI